MDLLDRIGSAMLLIGVVGLIVGYWWARKRVLEEERNRKRWGSALVPQERGGDWWQ